jgi:alanine dehydrogenase
VIRLFDAAPVEAALPWPALVDALRAGFRAGAELPVRHHHSIPRPGQDDAVLLLMPAWQKGGATGVKLVHICSGNEAQGLPTVQGLFVLFDGPTGTPRAVLDGTALTLRRTAATSALAADFLARPDAERLLVVGAGALAPQLARAHAARRPIRRIQVWNRTAERAAALAGRLAADGLAAEPAPDLEGAVREADIVTCCTMSREPLVRGAWLKPGAHVDLVGAFTPAMRESDDEVMRRGSVFVDTFDGALTEAGDVLLALASGALERAAIRADLMGLCRGEHPGRTAPEEITVFKSVGSALEDLVAARLVVERAGPA